MLLYNILVTLWLRCIDHSMKHWQQYGQCSYFTTRSTKEGCFKGHAPFERLLLTKLDTYICMELEPTMMKHNFSRHATPPRNPSLPTMIVFDLDDSLWTPELFLLDASPSIPVEGDLTPRDLPLTTTAMRGVVGVRVPRVTGPTVQLYPGARRALYELATNPTYAGIVLAVASSSPVPSYSHSCLEKFEILPGLTLRNMIKYDQIGRSGKLSSDKRSHFRLLHEQSQIPYSEMLFFDDCNWCDHASIVGHEFGVVTQRTPTGLQYSEFIGALEKYRTMQFES